jgi:hypothetical protein
MQEQNCVTGHLQEILSTWHTVRHIAIDAWWCWLRRDFGTGEVGAARRQLPLTCPPNSFTIISVPLQIFQISVTSLQLLYEHELFYQYFMEQNSLLYNILITTCLNYHHYVNTAWFYNWIKSNRSVYLSINNNYPEARKCKGKADKLSLKQCDNDVKRYLRLFNMDLCISSQFIKTLVLFLPSDEQQTRDILFCYASPYI